METRSGREILLEALRDDLMAFIGFAIPVLRAGASFERTWVIDALSQELQLLTRNKVQRLIVNAPPRSLKSTVISAIFSAWCIGHNPSARIICASYNDSLAVSLTADFRKLIAHPLFREAFPAFAIDKAKNTEFETRTTAGGYRLATTVGGTLTGRGADVIIVDDPLNAVNALSAAERERVNTWFDVALLSRLDQRSKGVVIVVMQRLHEYDLSGHLLEKGGWRHFCLPVRNIDGDRSFPLFTGGHYHWPAGADLLPTRLSRAVQDEIRVAMGEANFSAQYLQAPIPEGGAIVKTAWLKSYPEPPPRAAFQRLVHSWDVATKPSQAADYSVCTIWGMTHKGDYYLLDCRRVRLAFPDLVRLARDLIRLYPPTDILVEDAVNGAALAQELATGYGYKVHPIRPKQDKETRLHAATPAMESGRVYIPEAADWLAAYIHELTGFPGSRHDDQVDSTSQFINWGEERFRNGYNLNPIPWSLEKDDTWMR
jgi:predicted phage terminase large subunit-like protein